MSVQRLYRSYPVSALLYASILQHGLASIVIETGVTAQLRGASVRLADADTQTFKSVNTRRSSTSGIGITFESAKTLMNGVGLKIFV